jgi:hypothetical protein
MLKNKCISSSNSISPILKCKTLITRSSITFLKKDAKRSWQQNSLCQCVKVEREAESDESTDRELQKIDSLPLKEAKTETLAF